MTRPSRPHTPAQRTTRAKRALSSNTPCVTMDYAFTTYTKFAFCITGPCFRYKTILFDYSSGDPLPPGGGKSCCEPMPDDVRPPPGRDGEDRRRLMIRKEDAAPAGPQRRAQQGRQPGSAHASLSEVFAITMDAPIPSPLLRHPIISSNQ